MTEINKQVVIAAGSPYLGTRVKGDLSNRIDCAIDKTKNALGGLAQDTFVLGGAGLASFAVVKNEKVAKGLGGLVQKGADWFAGLFKTKNIKLPKGTIMNGKPITGAKLKLGGWLEKFATKLNKLPNKYKALGAIGLVAGTLLVGITTKRVKNAGRIEQQYQDQAIVDRHQKISLS